MGFGTKFEGADPTVIKVSTAIFVASYHGDGAGLVGASRTVHFNSSYTMRSPS